jgi:hypothetical protein
MLIDRLAYALWLWPKLCDSLTFLPTRKGVAFFDNFSRKSIIYWVASTSHLQPLILSEADCALKHEMRKLAGLKLWHATSCHDHPRIGSGAPVAASVLVCLDE